MLVSGLIVDECAAEVFGLGLDDSVHGIGNDRLPGTAASGVLVAQLEKEIILS